MKDQSGDDESILKAQQQAHQRMDAMREQGRLDRARSDWEQCDQSRKEQILFKKEKADLDKKEQLEEACEARERHKVVEAKETADQKAVRARNKECADANMKIAEEKREKKRQDKEESKKETQSFFK